MIIGCRICRFYCCTCKCSLGRWQNVLSYCWFW